MKTVKNVGECRSAWQARAGCSKLMTLLANDSIKFETLKNINIKADIFGRKMLRVFCNVNHSNICT